VGRGRAVADGRDHVGTLDLAPSPPYALLVAIGVSIEAGSGRLGIGDEASTGDELQWDRDRVGVVSLHPRVGVRVSECGEARRVDDLVGLADADHAPSRACLQVEVVDLESDDGVPGGGSELAAVLGPEDDLLVVEVVSDRLHRGQRAISERDPTDRATGEEAQALGSLQLMQLAGGEGVVHHGVLHRLCKRFQTLHCAAWREIPRGTFGLTG